jgi:hypothetical protein
MVLYEITEIAREKYILLHIKRHCSKRKTWFKKLLFPFELTNRNVFTVLSIASRFSIFRLQYSLRHCNHESRFTITAFITTRFPNLSLYRRLQTNESNPPSVDPSFEEVIRVLSTLMIARTNSYCVRFLSAPYDTSWIVKLLQRITC